MAHPEQHEDTAALSLRDLRAGYNGRTVLRGVDLDVPHGTFGAVVGPNGSGKSTLVKASLGLLAATRGSARFFGSPLARVRSRVAYVPQQDAVAEDFPITAVQVVEMGRYPHRGWFRRLTSEDDIAVAEAMEATGVQGLADTPLDELSGGQRQRVFLARALAQRADLLILDEPFTAVDARTESDLLSLLERLCATGVTVLAVHHDLRTVRDRFAYAVLLAGTVVAEGPVGDALSADNLERAYGIAPLAQPAATVEA
ncbi:metal ABC transporter ATP-binding protein [Haloechinothrix sp. YIM 98757]|uniref:Metal ABC transporter ATP-binding protein n=1 Tax=Haloechinothrix aidingensis TaxID=2752311 RepID=A0A838A827_9PSEU|nr:metal ABC transporter ATP-binding protein [Haloechinothrix aidingensis]MBA0124571.1 metal ABC transporter ATP-binding protein [Haloechinothrix aidingensis]